MAEFQPMVAIDAITAELIQTGSGQIFDESDTAGVVPLTVTDLSGVAWPGGEVPVVRGQVVGFDTGADGPSRVLWKSGSNTVFVWSPSAMEAAAAEVAAAAVSSSSAASAAAAAAADAADAAQQAAAAERTAAEVAYEPEGQIDATTVQEAVQQAAALGGGSGTSDVMTVIYRTGLYPSLPDTKPAGITLVRFYGPVQPTGLPAWVGVGPTQVPSVYEYVATS